MARWQTRMRRGILGALFFSSGVYAGCGISKLCQENNDEDCAELVEYRPMHQQNYTRRSAVVVPCQSPAVSLYDCWGYSVDEDKLSMDQFSTIKRALVLAMKQLIRYPDDINRAARVRASFNRSTGYNFCEGYEGALRNPAVVACFIVTLEQEDIDERYLQQESDEAFCPFSCCAYLVYS